MLTTTIIACGGGSADPELPTLGADDQAVSDERVVGGNAAPRGAFPSTAMLLFDGKLECGGTLIAPAWVLTAAHCVHESGKVIEATGLEVVLGRLRLSDSGGERIAVQQIVVHPDYAAQAIGSDLAMLQLKTASKGPAIQIVDGRADSTLLAPGSIAYAAGWGTTSATVRVAATALRYVDLALQSDADCRLALETEAPEEVKWFSAETEVCAGGVEDEDSCYGDSGGPLMVRRGKEFPFMLAGVVSWGAKVGRKGCGNAGLPGIYADPVALSPFVQDTLRAGGIVPPAAASEMRRGAVTDKKIQIAWQDNATNETHLIVASGVSGTDVWNYYRVKANTGDLTYNVTWAGPFVFAVQACNNAGCSAWSKTIEISPASP